MKIQYASDLHMEMGGSPLRRRHIGGDLLVLAGDIVANPSHLWDCFRGFLMTDIPVIYILGNHEFYHHDFASGMELYRMLECLPGVHLLEDQSIEIGGVRFLGTTLWSDFFGGRQGLAAEEGLNDFILISNGGDRLRWTDVAKRYHESLDWLTTELRTPFPGKTVVITHHAPSALSNPPQFAESPISGAFYSNLDDLIEETQPALWIHGHMHDSSDYRIGKTRVVCNPYGYRNVEVNVDWDPEARVEV
jgi:Icc-related predicted phosphoesterase